MTSSRSEVIKAEAALLFATNGVTETTVRDIGQAAGVYSGSLYHHFPSKDAILGAILMEFVGDVQERFEAVAARAETPESVVRGLIHETLRVIDEHPYATAIYQNDQRYLRDQGLLAPVNDASRSIRSVWMAAISAGVADGSFRDDVPPQVFYRSLRDALWATMHWPVRRDYDVDGFAELLATLFLDGFLARDR